MRNLWKSFTVKVGWIGSTVVSAAVAAPDQVHSLIADIGVPDDMASVVFKVLVIAGATATAGGVTYGRRMAERKPPLDMR